MPNVPGLKILIVDDEPQIRRFLRASLTAHDYEVAEAGTGGVAVRGGGIDFLLPSVEFGYPRPPVARQAQKCL
mgnify:CR=1 FL=1